MMYSRRLLLTPLLLFLLPLPLLPSAPDLVDPLPLRRVALPPERVAAELERAKQGTLVKLSREEFEARVARAARAGRAALDPPRLLETRYQCSFTDGGLVGQAQWTVFNPGSTAHVLSLPTFSLALRQAKFEEKDAILGELEGKTLDLLVERPGKQTLALEWSARGDARPGGVLFALRLPPCVLQSVEVELPADRTPSVSREVGLITGPEPAATPGRQVWRIECAGESQIDLLIRPSGATAEPALVLARVSTEQTLAPGAAEAQFTLQLDVQRGTLRELRCECSASLQPYRVTASERDVESWEHVPGTADGPALLLIRLREPVTTGALTVTVHALASFAPSKSGAGGIPWNCPGLRVEGAVSRGETLVLRVPPDIQLVNWNAGRFALKQTNTDAAGWQILTLRGPGDSDVPKDAGKPKAKPAAPIVRPQARLRVQEAEFRVRQQVWWQVGATEQTLTAQLTVEVTQGKLYRLLVQLPAWTLESAELQARIDGRDPVITDLVRTSTVQPVDANSSTLALDLQRGLAPGTVATLTVRLRHTPPRGAALPPTLNFPVLAPRGARLHESVLAISVHQAHQATASATEPEVPAEQVAASREPVWGKELPDFLYAARGQPVTGALTLRSRGPQVQVRCRTQVLLRGDRILVVSEVQVQPIRGNPQTLDLWLSARVASPGEWKTLSGANQVRRVERVGAAGGNLWRLVLAQPLREPVTLQTTVDLMTQRVLHEVSPAVVLFAAPSAVAAAPLLAAAAPLLTSTPAEPRWEIPLPVVLGAEQVTGEVTLHVPGGERLEVEARGLTEMHAGPRTGEATPYKAYRYDRPSVTLALHGGSARGGRGSDAVADFVRLTTTVQRDGLLLHHFAGRFLDWRRRTLPLRLPAGTQVLAIQLNGRWLVPPPLIEADQGRLLLELPVVEATTAVDLELIYTTRAAAGTLGTRFAAPLPILPVTPLAVRRTWRLPPGLVPVWERNYARLPSPVAETTIHGLSFSPRGDRDTETDAWLFAPWRTAQEARWIVRQRQEMADAAGRAWQALPAAPERRLGSWLHAIVFDAARTDEQIVMDTVALAHAGLNQHARLPAQLPAATAGTFPWEELGLVHMPIRSSVALLTTVRQYDAWRTVDRGTESLHAAVGAAAQFGQDASGRFERAASWLQDPDPTKERAPLPRDLAASLAACFAGDWTEYAPLAEDAAADMLLAVRQDALPGLALVFSALILVAAWGIRNGPWRHRYGLLLLGLLLGGLALLWLPPPLRLLAFWPTLAVGLTAVVWYVGSLLARPLKLSTGTTSAVTAALVLVALAGTVPGQGDAQNPLTVWLLPDRMGTPGQGGVLAPPQVLDELDQLSRRGVAAFTGAVLLGAQYEGQADGGATEWTAEYRVWSFAEESADLILPLTGVELQEMLLDGAPAFPSTLPAPQVGYGVKVKGRGAHTLRVRFAVRSQQNHGEYELRFTVPRLVRNRLQLKLREAATDLHVVHGPNGGAQTVTPEEGGLKLEADLGRTATVLVRWRPTGAKQEPPKLEVREAYLWHLRAEGSRLQGVIRWIVGYGAVSTLRVDLPDGLEVARVEPFAVTPPQLAPRLAGWTVERDGTRRRLRLEFQNRITSAVQIELELVPSRPFTAAASLTIPSPEGASVQNVHLGVNVDGIEAAVVDHLRITAVDRAVFVAAWKNLGQPDPGALPFRYTVRRGPEAAPLLRLLLNLAPGRLQAAQNLAWQIGPRRADLRLTAHVTAAVGDELALVEWEVPGGVTVADVRGPHVRGWSSASGRVQVWLQRAVRETPLQTTTLELFGWQPRASTEAPFTTPRIRILGAAQQATLFRVSAGDGWALEPAKLSGLLPLPELRPTPEFNYVARDDTAGGTFRVFPAVAGADVRLLTFLEVRERRLHFVTTIDYTLRQGELRTVVLRLHNWDQAEVQLDAERVATRQEYGREGQRRSWVLHFQPGVTGAYQVRLSGSRPLDGTEPLLAPDVSLVGTPAERWVAAAGSELLSEGVRGLKPLPAPESALAQWPAVADRLRRAGGSVWRVESADWQMRLRPRASSAGGSAIQVVWSEHVAGRPDGRRWVYESTWRLFQETGTEVRLRLPSGAVALALSLDGQDLVSPAADRQQVLLSLPRGGGLSTVRLCWMMEGNLSPPIGPVLTPPQLDGAADGPSYWLVYAPAEHGAHARGPGIVRTTAAALELHRAASWLPLCVPLADQVQAHRDSPAAAQLQDVQERFYRHCRQAEHLLAQPEEQLGGGPKGQSLSEWLHELREQNRQLAQEHEFDRLRQRAERRAQTRAVSDSPSTPQLRANLLTERGLPMYWIVQAGTLTATLSVEPLRSETIWQELLLSLLVLAVLGLAWWLPRVPNLLPWLHTFWPEELALTGVLIWWTLDLILPSLLLLAAGLAVRAYLLAHTAMTYLRPNLERTSS